MVCQSRITKQFKTAKANCIWPEDEIGSIKSEHWFMYPQCGGTVTFKIHNYECYGDPTLEANLECSNCKKAYIPGIYSIFNDPAGYIEKVLNG